MPGVSLKLVGADELRRKLTDLDAKIARKITSQTLRAAAKIVLSAAQQRAPVQSGLLKRSLKVRAGKRKAGTVRFVVQTAAGNYQGETFYGAFLEFGHRRGKRTRSGDNRQQVAPRPFMQPAYEQAKDEALAVVTQTLRAGIEAAAR